MAREQRKKEDLFIKEKKRSKSFFITSSAKMDESDGVNKTTISSSVFTEISKSFSDGVHLLDSGMRNSQGPLLYMMQQIQEDLDDVYNEVSASAFEASYFPFATIDSGSFGVISSSLVPDKDEKYNLGSSGKEWHTSYMLTASIGGGIFTSASLAAGGGGNADFSSVGEHIIPATDDTYSIGASNKQFKDLYIDGTANIDSLSADSFAKPTAPVVQTATSLKSSLVDVTGIHTLVLNSSKALSIDGLVPLHPGQELTIMNINSGAVTISRSQGGKARTIYGSGNITINQHQAYKFVCNPSQVWYQIS